MLPAKLKLAGFEIFTLKGHLNDLPVKNVHKSKVQTEVWNEHSFIMGLMQWEILKGINYIILFSNP